MDDEAIREIIGVYKDTAESMRRIELLLVEMHHIMNGTEVSVEEMNGYFKNGFKTEIIDKISENYQNTVNTYGNISSKEFNLLFYKLIASSSILITLLSLIVYIISKGKIKFPSM